MNRWVWIILLSGILLSCEEEVSVSDQLGQNAGIVGTWVQERQDPDRLLLSRSSTLDPDKYGFIVKAGGEFIERKNAGWCGTPPITYADFEGTWVALSDSLLEVTVGYWGGTITYQMRVISLDNEQLTIRYQFGEDRTSSK